MAATGAVEHLVRMENEQARHMPAALVAALSVAGNAECFECGVAPAKWGALTYGVFLCAQCSGVHRSLGTHLSVVRSLTLDQWSDEQLARMRVGGNRRLRAFFVHYHVRERDAPLPAPGKFNKRVYSHAAARVYREKITALVRNEAYDVPSVSQVDEMERVRRREEQADAAAAAAAGGGGGGTASSLSSSSGASGGVGAAATGMGNYMPPPSRSTVEVASETAAAAVAQTREIVQEKAARAFELFDTLQQRYVPTGLAGIVSAGGTGGGTGGGGGNIAGMGGIAGGVGAQPSTSRNLNDLDADLDHAVLDHAVASSSVAVDTRPSLSSSLRSSSSSSSPVTSPSPTPTPTPLFDFLGTDGSVADAPGTPQRTAGADLLGAMLTDACSLRSNDDLVVEFRKALLDTDMPDTSRSLLLTKFEPIAARFDEWNKLSPSTTTTTSTATAAAAAAAAAATPATSAATPPSLASSAGSAAAEASPTMPMSATVLSTSTVPLAIPSLPAAVNAGGLSSSSSSSSSSPPLPGGGGGGGGAGSFVLDSPLRAPVNTVPLAPFAAPRAPLVPDSNDPWA